MERERKSFESPEGGTKKFSVKKKKKKKKKNYNKNKNAQFVAKINRI